jgi:hypothetical protein
MTPLPCRSAGPCLDAPVRPKSPIQLPSMIVYEVPG